MTDPRQADIDEAAGLFDAAARMGAAPLPDLVAVDLCVLGAELQSVFDEPVWRAWLALDEAQRDKFVLNVLNGLAQRRLLDPPDSPADPVLRMRAPLALIMAARSQPCFVCVCSPGGDAPRMYGIAEEGTGLRAVLLERAGSTRIRFGTRQIEELSPTENEARAGDLNRIYQYLLMAPEYAIRILAARLGEYGGQAADVYRHREGEEITRVRIVAGEPDAEARLEDALLTGAPA